MRTLGVKNEVLDKIKVILNYDTAKRLGICRGADKYWSTKEEKKPLAITAKNLAKFAKLPDLDGLEPRVNTKGWIYLLEQQNRTSWFDLFDEDLNYSSYKTVERSLKVWFIKFFEPKVYRALCKK